MRLTPQGGYAPYTYSLTGRVSQSIDSFNKIIAGIYTIQVTDRNGCNIQRTDTIVPFTNLSLTINRDSAKCFGDSSGRIIASLTGGKPGYLYSINNGVFNASGIFNLLPTGSYSIKTKDAANCPIDTTITIAQYPIITAVNTKQNNCPFNSNGTVSISASGGNPVYEYRYNNGAFQSSSNFINLINGVFTYSVRDRNNCIRIFTDTLKSHPKPDIGIAMKKNVSCYGFSDGKIRVNISSGKSPFTYSWNIAGSNDSIANLSSGTYTAFVNDSNNCKDTLAIQITQPDSLRASLNFKHPLCYLSLDGYIKVLPIGGTPPFLYSINGGGFSSVDSFAGLTGAVYTIQVRDSQFCIKTYTQTLTNPPAIQLALLSDSVKCFGTNGGKIQIIATGGTPGYTYRLNTMAFDTFSNKPNLFSANYTLSIRDLNGCQKDSSIQVASYSQISLTKTILDTIRCKNGNDGRISLTASGGKSPYTFSINGGGFQASNIFANLNVGMKYFRVRDAFNCEFLDSILLSEPAGMTSNIVIQKNVACYGQSNGKARVIVVGGILPYSYLWSNGITIDSTSTLNSGIHYVRITDTKNCKDSVSFTITQPDSLHANLSLYNPRCHNTLGSIKVNPLGGTAPYQFSINASAFSSTDSFTNLLGIGHSIVVLDNNFCSKTFSPLLITPSQLTATYKVDSVRCFGASTGRIIVNYSGGTGTKTIRSNTIINAGDTVKNLSAGNYLIEVSDANNCKVDSLVNLAQYADIVLNVQKDTVKCFGSATASMSISVTGGAGGYSYGVNSSAFGSSNIFTGLAAGIQLAKVSDKYQCQKTQNVTITQIDSMSINTQLTHNLCFRDSLGKVKFLISGGTPPYSISFNGSGYGSIDSFVKLPAGSFMYSVRDINNCLKNGNVIITQPTPLISSTVIDSVKCFKQSTGSIVVNPSGGTPNYMFSFNGQAFVSGNSFVNLAAGTYNVKIRDANLCIKDTNVVVKSSDSFYFSYLVDSIDCNNANNGRVNIMPAGGKPPYQFSLNAGVFNSNNIISNLTPTNHTIQIRDAYNCILNLPISLTNPSPIVIQIDSNIPNNCFNESKGRLQVSSSGGTLPHSYSWSNSGVLNRIINLPAGTYTVTVMDAKNCIKTLTTSISQPTDFSIIPNQTNLKCFGDGDGSISIIVSGSNPSYSYLWSNGATTSNISNLIGGTYSITITDANQCKTNRSYTITQPDSIYFDLVKTNSHCASSKDGSILVGNLSGGVMPPSYQWSHGPTTMNVNSLEPFITYTLTITDNNGCKKQKSSYIDTMYVLRIKLDTLGIPRCPYSLLNLKMSPLTGTSPFEFNLGGLKNNTGDFSNQKNIKYVYTINDVFNCSFTDSVDLVPRDTMKLSLILYPPPCESANIFPVKAKVTGSKSPYIFEWPRAFQSFDDSARFNLSGFYQVNVRDFYNCLVSSSFNLALPDGALQGVIEKKNLRCHNLNDGVLKIEGRGGIQPYNYLWSTGETSQKIQNLKANVKYKVTVFDSDTCRYELEESLTQPDSLEASVRKTDKTCIESTNGSIQVFAKGGTPKFKYSLDTTLGFQKDSFFNYIDAGNYSVSVIDDSLCQVSLPVLIDIKYKLSLTLDSIFQIKAGETVFLNPSLNLTPSSAFYIAEWTPSLGLSCTDCLSPEYSGYHTTYLDLNLKYGEGCITNISTLIKVVGTQDDELFIPNTFSPNAEKIENRTFKAYANRVLRFEMSVYNRWGEKVFETDDIRQGWDGNYKGELAAKGVYTYILRLTKLDGIRIVRSGEVNLF
jgi:gliding motility-associated-like protein